MKYLLTIYSSEAAYAQMAQADVEAEYGAYFVFTNEVRESGALLGGEALHPTTTATTVRVRDGKALTTDGPFAETKEALGGFYLIECKNLDEAIHWAAKIPGATHGSIEIRPVMDFSQTANA